MAEGVSSVSDSASSSGTEKVADGFLKPSREWPSDARAVGAYLQYHWEKVGAAEGNGSITPEVLRWKLTSSPINFIPHVDGNLDIKSKGVVSFLTQTVLNKAIIAAAQAGAISKIKESDLPSLAIDINTALAKMVSDVRSVVARSIGEVEAIFRRYSQHSE